MAITTQARTIRVLGSLPVAVVAVMTADSFQPQRDERINLRARAIVAALRAYENSPHPWGSPCLVAALREAEEACGLAKDEAL